MLVSRTGILIFIAISWFTQGEYDLTLFGWLIEKFEIVGNLRQVCRKQFIILFRVILKMSHKSMFNIRGKLVDELGKPMKIKLLLYQS